MGLQTRQPQERHQFDGKAKNSQWFLKGSVNSPRSRRSIRILDLYPHSRRTGAIRAHGPSMHFSFFCTAKVRENTIHAPHRLRKLLRSCTPSPVPRVAAWMKSGRRVDWPTASTTCRDIQCGFDSGQRCFVERTAFLGTALSKEKLSLAGKYLLRANRFSPRGVGTSA
jgi:hypothetical protein